MPRRLTVRAFALAVVLLLAAACSSGSGGTGGVDTSNPCPAYCARFRQVCEDPHFTGTSTTGLPCQDRCDQWASITRGHAQCSDELDAMHACLAAHPIECDFGFGFTDPGRAPSQTCVSELWAWSSCVD